MTLTTITPRVAPFTQPFASRAAFLAANIPAQQERAAFVVNGQSYSVIRDASGPIQQTSSGNARWRPDGIAAPQHFGAEGNGSGDDTAALNAAIAWGGELHFGPFVYRHTGVLSGTVAKLRWLGQSATLLYAGGQVRRAVNITCGLNEDHTVEGIIFDGGDAAHVAARFAAATASEAYTSWPRFYGRNLVARNARRLNTNFLDGDGLRIDGGFARAELDSIKVHDCYATSGAEVPLAQGIFGITFGTSGSRAVRHIQLSNFHVERVWSENAVNKSDQDAVRVFQETGVDSNSCQIRGGSIVNVANRAVKLHSTTNAVIDGLHIIKDAAVIPQSGEMTNADVDAQQGPATITNIRAYYKGVWHRIVVQNHTESTAVKNTGASITDNISVCYEDCGNTENRVVQLNLLDSAPTAHRAHISNIFAVGDPVRWAAVITSTTGSTRNSVVAANIAGNFSEAPFRIQRPNSVSSGSFVLDLSAVNIAHTGGSAVPFVSQGPGATGSLNCFGGANIEGLGFVGQTTAGLGVNGVAAVSPLDLYPRDSTSQRIRLRGQANVSTEQSYIAWLEWFHQVLEKRLGYIGFPSGSNQHLEIVCESTTGDAVLRAGGNQLRLLNGGGMQVTGIPTSPPADPGRIWNDGGTLKIT